MPREYIKILKVPVGQYNNEIIYMKTIVADDGQKDNGVEKPAWVLIHGFGGAGIYYYKLI